MTFFYELNKRMAALADKQELHESKVAESEKWIQGAVNPAHKGGLHKALHVAQDKTIPKAKIEKATHSKNPKLRHMAQFAKNVAHEDIEQEGNAFTGALKATPKGGKFKVGGKEFKDTSSIEEGQCPKCAPAPCTCNEGNAFTGKLKSTPQGGKFKLGNKEFKDTSSIEEKKEPRSKGTAFDPEVMSKIEKEKDPHPRHDVKDTGYSKRYTRKHEDDVENDKDDSKSNQADKYASPKKKGRPQSAAPKDSERVTKGSHKYDVVDGKRVKKVKENEEYDDEGSMAKGDMHTVIRHATELEKHLRDQENLPTWVIEKIGQIKGMMTSVSDYILSQHERGAEQATGQEGIRIAERSKSQAQARMMAGAAHDPKFAKKVGVKQSVAKEFNKADTGKKMSSLPKKVKAKEEVDETTTSGSVATATPSGKSSKGGMSFGKGVYESFNNSLEKMISESIDVTETVNEHEQEGKTITVTASGPEADMLMQLLKAAGLSGQGQSQGCGCGTTPCSCETVDEAYGDTDETLNNPDWPTDTEKSDNAFQYSGGLNGPKSTGQTTTVGGGIPNMQARRQVSMEENVKLERSLFKTWKNYKG